MPSGRSLSFQMCLGKMPLIMCFAYMDGHDRAIPASIATKAFVSENVSTGDSYGSSSTVRGTDGKAGVGVEEGGVVCGGGEGGSVGVGVGEEVGGGVEGGGVVVGGGGEGGGVVVEGGSEDGWSISVTSIEILNVPESILASYGIAMKNHCLELSKSTSRISSGPAIRPQLSSSAKHVHEAKSPSSHDKRTVTESQRLLC